MKTSSLLEERFKAIVSSWGDINAGDYFYFVIGYGETNFFLDLWTLLDTDPNFKVKYAHMVHAYFTAKKYFREH